MTTARYVTPAEDIDWEEWGYNCGIEFVKLEPREDGWFDLFMEGPGGAIALFTMEMGYAPEEWEEGK